MSALQETLSQHPYVIGDNNLDTPRMLTSARGFESAVTFGQTLLNKHVDRPIDLIVGEDVSGRVPALIAHRLFRLASDDQRIKTVPRTVFMASGQLNDISDYSKYRRMDIKWKKNLKEHAQKILGSASASRVVIITELVSTGKSTERLTEAFQENNISDVSYLVGPGIHLSRQSDRRIVGVEKKAPNPTSYRHPWFNAHDSADLRHFLDDYTLALYQSIQDQEHAIDDIDDLEVRGGY